MTDTIDELVSSAFVRARMKEVGFARTLKELKQGRFSDSRMLDIQGGVAELWSSGRIDAAIETNEGRVIIEAATVRQEDIQAISEPLQARLKPLQNAIMQSRDLLDIGDEEMNVDELAWQRAADFLLGQATRALRTHKTLLPVPDILPGPSHSIDLHWETSGFELLINVPSDTNQLATFYGDDHNTMEIRGKLDPSKVNPGVLSWLTGN